MISRFHDNVAWCSLGLTASLIPLLVIAMVLILAFGRPEARRLQGSVQAPSSRPNAGEGMTTDVLQKAVPSQRPHDPGASYVQRARAHQDWGEYEEAAALLRDALVARTQAFGSSSPEVADTFAQLGSLLDEQEEFVAAELSTKHAIMIRQGLPKIDPVVQSELTGQLARIRCRRAHWPDTGVCELDV